MTKEDPTHETNFYKQIYPLQYQPQVQWGPDLVNSLETDLKIFCLSVSLFWLLWFFVLICEKKNKNKIPNFWKAMTTLIYFNYKIDYWRSKKWNRTVYEQKTGNGVWDNPSISK